MGCMTRFLFPWDWGLIDCGEESACGGSKISTFDRDFGNQQPFLTCSTPLQKFSLTRLEILISLSLPMPKT